MAGQAPSFTERIRRAGTHAQSLQRTLLLVWHAAATLSLIWAALLVVQGLIPVGTVYLTRSLVNHLVAALNSRGAWVDLRPTLISMGLMAGLLLARGIIQAASEWVRTLQSELVEEHITTLVHRKTALIDMSYYDLVEYYDHMDLARMGAQRRPVTLLEGMGSLVQNGITLTAMAGILVPFGWWLPFAIILSTLPTFYVVSKFAAREYEWMVNHRRDQRLAGHYDWVLTNRETASEVRLFDLGGYFQAAYRTARRKVRAGRMDLARRRSLAQVAAEACGLLVCGGTLVWVALRAIGGQATAGDVALVYQVFNQALRPIRAIFDRAARLYTDLLVMGNLFEFLSLEPKLKDPVQPVSVPTELREGIRFRGVTFQYPESSRNVVEDFDLFVPFGQMVALVGENGAGKSTLIKLLCRFYDPQAGSIELDGTDLRDLRVEDVRGLVTVLFQQPVRYHATVKENIALGNLRAHLGTREIAEAARAAGAEEIISRLPRSYETELGKVFAEGADLSVGEWQRVALARACVRKCPIVVLDEPTSAMDPWAEADWLRNFRRLTARQTVLLITHRFTTAMFADDIHVISGGRIVESGTHTELLERGGRYAVAWRASQQTETLG